MARILVPKAAGARLAEAEWQRQRARHLAGLCRGRRLHLAGKTDSGAQAVLAREATLVDAAADVVAVLAAMAAPDDLPGLKALLRPEGLLIVTDAPDGTEARFGAALRALFTHVVTLRQLAVDGSVIVPARQAGSRILPLSGPPQGACVALIHLCSDAAFTVPGMALHESGQVAAWCVPPAPPVAGPGIAVPPAAGATGLGDLRARAVALAERLVRQTDALAAQPAEAEQHRRPPPPGETPSGPALLPRPRWPLASEPGLAPDQLEIWERRVDDAVILELRAGESFQRRFGLRGDAPDFAGAVAALNRRARDVGLAPMVSVVIPVHGQLAATLNCLDSLWGLPDRAAFEVIVIDDASPDETGAMLPQLRGLRMLRLARNQGFIASCNRGAADATGRFVLFLNNDTRVVPGWLDALVDSFDLFPRAGLVGSKMFHPDGSLQEAGGIIWRDGSGWNDGRGDDPNRPEYSFARQVDYVSGCSIMLPMALWRSLAGFDPTFSPAYCEDADLALRVREAGFEVWFQPQSRVLHDEGLSSGKDVSRGVKAYQTINARKLYLRWRDVLARHRANGEQVALERERDVHRRALVIDATAPTPKQDAGSVTALLTMRLFQRLGYKVHYVPQDNFLYQPGHVDDLLREGIEVAYGPYDTDFTSYIREHGARFDVVLVFRVTVMERVIEDLRRYAPQAPVVFQLMDLHFLRMQREARLTGDAAALRRAEEMRGRELDLIRRADCTVTHSSFERDLLIAAVPEAPLSVWPFLFPLHGTEVGFAARRDFCFLGGYGHTPNIDAVRFMVREVMPLIWREDPAARFIIAGANPTHEVMALASERVIVTGQIDDLRTVFDATRVFACSLRVGAGVKGKISTAMSYGLPVVSTTCGAEGIDLIDGEEVLIADAPEHFAAACLRLYRDPALWARLSAAGLRRVQEKHSLEVGEGVLADAIERALRRKLELD